jgi:hypothetical protein
MSFVVEDGTGLTNSTAYAAEAEFDSYWTDRNVDVSGINSTAKKACLIKGTQFIDTNYRALFKGFRLTNTQALQWPRQCARDEFGASYAGIPVHLKYACIEYAFRANTAALQPDPIVDDSGLQVSSKIEKVGPIEENTSFLSSSVQTVKAYPAADAWLAEFLSSTGGGSSRV